MSFIDECVEIIENMDDKNIYPVLSTEDTYKVARKVLLDMGVTPSNPNYEDYLQELVMKEANYESKGTHYSYVRMKSKYLDLIRYNHGKKRDTRLLEINEEKVNNKDSKESNYLSKKVEDDLLEELKSMMSEEMKELVFNKIPMKDVAESHGIKYHTLRNRIINEFDIIKKNVENRKDYEDIKKIILRKINGE